MFEASLQDHWRSGAEGCWELSIPEGWTQGRTVYGGLTAAAAVALARRHLVEVRPLRVGQFQFLRPAQAGRLEGRAELLRQGRYSSFLQVQIFQADVLVLQAQLTFLQPRPQRVQLPAPEPWTGPDPESLTDLPYLPALMPEYLQQLQLRWIDGPPPFSGAKEAGFRGYIRFREPAGSIEGLLGLLDAWPCPTLSLYSGPVRASTVSWTVHFLQVPERLSGWSGFAYGLEGGDEGCHTVSGRLYDAQGELMAWTEQAVVVFDGSARASPAPPHRG